MTFAAIPAVAAEMPTYFCALAGDETSFAELDLSEIGQGLASLDTDGHYSPPDVFELSIGTRSRNGVN